MSEENVEIVRRQIWRGFQAGMERGDPGAVFDAGPSLPMPSG